MSEGWKNRLAKAVQEDGRSLRAISMAAKCGPNYLSEVLSKDKVPSVEKLLRLCDELKVSAAYILTGADVSPESEEMLSILSSLSPQQQETMLALARELKGARP